MQNLSRRQSSHFIQCLWAMILLISGSDLTSGEISFKNGSPHVKLSNGALLSGSVEYSREGRAFNSFVGVPFGKIPGRFEEAEPAPKWDGIFEATTPGEICVQPTDVDGKVITIGREDCLNLNVYVPTNGTQVGGGYPVMVMIHGGGFSCGSGYILGPKFLMDENIVFVSMNYRLSAAGFLSTGDSVLSGNNGLKDQVLALRWVQENIRNFGGDPKSVTVCGISAGGASVHYLTLSPTTNGLFQRAVAQSGNIKSPWAYNPNPRENAVKLATYLKCPTEAADKLKISSEEIVTCLKKLPFDELNIAQFKFDPRWPSYMPPFIAFYFGPVTESKDSKSPFFTDTPWNITEPLMKIPLMTGTSQDEGVGLYAGVILQDQKLLDELDSKWEHLILKSLELNRLVPVSEQKLVAEKIRQFYFGDKKVSKETRSNLINLYSDAFFVHPVRRTVNEIVLKGHGNPYLYQYAYHGPGSTMNLTGFPIGAEDLKKVSHADDFIMNFNIENLVPTMSNIVEAGSPDEEFSKNFNKLWVSFATNGKPTHTWGKTKQEWKPVSKEDLNGKSPLKWYRIDSNPHYIDGGRIKESVEFWTKLYDEHILPNLPKS